MSSQVITTLPGTTNDYSNSKNPSDSPISSETEIEPGKQKNFYRQVSGAGDGLPSQTTADFGPKGLSKIVKMQENNGDSVESGIGDVGETLPISEESNGGFHLHLFGFLLSTNVKFTLNCTTHSSKTR